MVFIKNAYKQSVTEEIYCNPSEDTVTRLSILEKKFIKYTKMMNNVIINFCLVMYCSFTNKVSGLCSSFLDINRA